MLQYIAKQGAARRIKEAIVQEEIRATSHFALILTAVFPRVRIKYGIRGYRFALLEAGHIAQNIYLLASAIDLGIVALGGFYDAEIDECLAVNGIDESVVYVLAGGKRDRILREDHGHAF